MTWELKPVSELCLFAIDCVNKTAPVVDYETPYKMIRTNNVKGGFIDLENVRYVEEEVFENWTRRSKPQYGDVVLTREAPVGDVGRFTSHDENVFLGQRLFHYRPDPELLDWRYLAYVLQSEALQGWVKGIAFGATVPHIKVSDAENLKIPVPPIETQKKIGTILASYDDLIENNLKRIKLFEETAQTTYEEWFIRLKFPEYENTKIDDKTGLPDGWTRDRVDKIFVLQRGFDLPVQDRVKGDIPIIASTGIIDWHSESKVKGAGVITGRSGTIGEVEYSPNDFWPLNTSLWIKEYKEGGPFFAYHFLKNFDLNRLGGGSAVPSLDRKVVHSQRVAIPTSELIDLYEKQIQPVFTTINNLQKQNIVLQEARNILLPRLMTGMIDVDKITIPNELIERVTHTE